MSRGRFERARSRKHALKRCKMKKNTDNVVIIDIDGDDSDEVIIIDALESLQQKSHGPSGLGDREKRHTTNIVSIDDDNVDDDHPGAGSDNEGDLDSESTSNKKSISGSNQFRSFMDSDGDDCQVIGECSSYYDKAPNRNRYGLNTESENGFSESDCSDCEVMEGSSGKQREQWERAFTKRKYNDRNVESGLEDMASASGSHDDADPVVATKNCNELHPDVSEEFPFVATGNGDIGGTSLDPELDSYFAKFNCNDDQERFSCFNANASSKTIPIFGNGSGWARGETSSERPLSRFSLFQSEEEPNFPRRNEGSDQGRDDKHCNSGIGFQEKAQTFSEEPCHFNFNPINESHSDQSEINVQGIEPSFNSIPCKAPTHHDKFVSRENDVEFNPGHSSSLNECTGLQAKEEFCSIPLRSESEVDNRSAAFQQECERTNLVCVQKGVVTPVTESNIINERERMKETEEYKRAIEEEWASRQLQLHIQAEEAQRLRKRRRAESMRLLDMERRQKQRLEEVRATQKQDEENLNLKEVLRVEIRKVLTRLETTCVDMASVLRGLGIKVGDSVYPLPHEVHAAYKRALLKFHPDRASRNNIREQVEAEEKFKLMSLMKEKLPWTAL